MKQDASLIERRRHTPKSLEAHTKYFVKTFEPLRHTQDSNRAFADFIEIAALTVHQSPYHAGMLERDEEFDHIEARYMDAVKRYSREELDIIAKLYGICQMALLDLKMDFIGHVFMTLEHGNKHSGQFFTPACVQKMMAKMSLPNARQTIEQRGFISVAEPAAGGGGMLIEAANELEYQGFIPQAQMLFEARELDSRVFNICYFQLSILGLCGVVIHCNTLSLETWETRKTPQYKVLMANVSPIERAFAALRIMEGSHKEIKPSPTTVAVPLVEGKGGQFGFDFTLPAA